MLRYSELSPSTDFMGVLTEYDSIDGESNVKDSFYSGRIPPGGSGEEGFFEMYSLVHDECKVGMVELGSCFCYEF